jgi:hypothetical protein
MPAAKHSQQLQHSQEIGSRCFRVRPASRLLPDRTDGLLLEAAARGGWVNTDGAGLLTTIQLRADGVIKLGCEGIVSKRLGSPYRSGRSAH